jgi:hypothetical protein
MKRTKLIVATVVLTELSAPAFAGNGTGIYNSDGWVNETNGVTYYHGNDGVNGFQSNINGNTYYHGSDGKNCFSNEVLGTNYVHCN